MLKEKKIQEVELLTEQFKSVKSIYITEYRGLTVAELYELRNKLREADAEYKVVKNRLTKIALGNAGLDKLKEYFKGPVAVTFIKSNPIKPAKILSDFAKNHDKLIIKAGLMDNNLLNSAEIKELANLPSREILLGRLAGALSSPIYNFVRVLQGPIYGFVNVIEQIKKQKESAEQTA